MATVQKTTVRRFNGVDWDSIYFASAADVTVLGTAAKVARDTSGFEFGDILEFNDTVAELLIKVINRLTTLDVERITALEKGEGITSISADKIEGVISRDNLPEDIGGKTVPVASEEERGKLTADDVNVGDIVKVEGGKTYIVTNTEPDGTVEYLDLVDNESPVEWARIANTPTTLKGYGITDAASSTDFQKLDDDVHKNFDAGWIQKGVLPLKVIPKAAISEIKTVESYEAMADLTAEDIQLGDTIKIKDEYDDEGNVVKPGKMYYVVDETKFGTEDWEQGVTPYTAGAASEVFWSGVLDTPTTLAGYGITDGVNVSDVIENGIYDADTNPTVAGKIVKISADNKLHADIAGDAATLGGNAPEYYATAADQTETRKDLDDLIKAVMGDPDAVVPGPSEDPESPAYTGDLKTTEEGQPANWGGKGWVVASKTETEAVLVLDTLAAVCANSDVNAEVTNFMATLSDECKALIGDGAYVPTKVELATYAGLTDLTLAYEGANAGWYLSDGYVDSTGAVVDDPSADAAINKGLRPFVKVNLTNPDSTAPTEPKKTLIERVEDVEKIIGDKTTEGTILNEIEKLKNGESITELDWAVIINTPTTLQGYGITDAVNVSDVIEDGIVSKTNTLENVAGKLVKLGADGKLHADIAGDAATLEGHKAEYFATKEEHDQLSLSVPVYLNSVDEFVDPKKGQMVMIPIGEPVEIGPDGKPVMPDFPEDPEFNFVPVTESVLGQDPTAIQNITFDGTTVTGTSEYISWPEFSSVPEDQEGNFIVLKIEPTEPGAVVKVKSKDGDAEGYKTLDDDHILIWKLTAGKNIEVKVNDTEYIIDVSGVTMNPKA